MRIGASIKFSSSENSIIRLIFIFHLGAFEAEHGAIEDNILAPTQFGMKARAQFQQGCDPSAHLDTAASGAKHARDDFEKGGLPGAIVADKSKRIAFTNLKIYLAQRPKKVVADAALQPANRSNSLKVETRSFGAR